MAKKVTPEEIQQMQQLYLQLGSYKAVAEKVGRSASTVSKYVKEAASAPVVQKPIYFEPIDWSWTQDLSPIDLKKVDLKPEDWKQ